jgi:peptidoglycan/xylan/chitin deacetylase (PgdA/CDA1 family)
MTMELLLGGSAALLLGGTFHPRVPLFGPVTWKGPKIRKAVSLTFDDGPDPRFTETVAHILEAHWKKATFFCIGQRADEYPELVKSLAKAGHDIQNHTYSHNTGKHLFSAKLLTEDVGRAQEVLRDLTGKLPTFYRPAVGIRNPPVHAAAKAHGLRVVTWSKAARDGSWPLSAKKAEALAKGASPGDIFALHDGLRGKETPLRSATLEHLPVLIDGLLARGFDIVPVSELLTPSSS